MEFGLLESLTQEVFGRLHISSMLSNCTGQVDGDWVFWLVRIGARNVEFHCRRTDAAVAIAVGARFEQCPWVVLSELVRSVVTGGGHTASVSGGGRLRCPGVVAGCELGWRCWRLEGGVHLSLVI